MPSRYNNQFRGHYFPVNAIGASVQTAIENQYIAVNINFINKKLRELLSIINFINNYKRY